MLSPPVCYCGICALWEYEQSSTRVVICVRGWCRYLFSFYHWILEDSLGCVALGMGCHLLLCYALFMSEFLVVKTFMPNLFISSAYFSYDYFVFDVFMLWGSRRNTLIMNFYLDYFTKY